MQRIVTAVVFLVWGMGMDARVLVHGHRGARAAAPENTLPAFEYAIAAGVDYLELDLNVTKDNVAVVSHDSVINATICEGPHVGKPIRTLTLAQVKELDCGNRKNPAYPNQKLVPGTKMPTFDEVLALAKKGSFEFNVETKMLSAHPEHSPTTEDFAKLVLESIRRHRLEKRVVIQSFDFRTLHALKRLAPEIRLSALYQGKPRDFVEVAREAGAAIISPHFSLVTREQVEKAHKAGLQVIPWTANTEEDWKRMVDAGADAIISDDPAALISYLKRARV
jgi:glycerophosphoryl diester phosphodiesterase